MSAPLPIAEAPQRHARFSRVALMLLCLAAITAITAEPLLANAEQSFGAGEIQGSGWANVYDPLSDTVELLHFNVIDGRAIYQGDIILGPASAFQTPEAPSRSDIQPGFALSSLGRRWPNGVVHYDLNNHPFSTEILDAMTYLEQNTSVRFEARTNQPGYVKFVSGTGCSSVVGFIGGEQEITLGPSGGCSSRGVITHELMHALGIQHEHQRPDRDQFITVHLENVQDGFEFAFDIISSSSSTTIGPYDIESIMHYQERTFSKNGMKTITSNTPGATVGGQVLTQGDIDTIEYLYGSSAAPNISITSPAANSSFAQGSNITLAGTATDPEDGTISNGIDWSSSLDGNLGSGASLTLATLSVGTHTITASITDSSNQTASAMTSLTVSPATGGGSTISNGGGGGGSLGLFALLFIAIGAGCKPRRHDNALRID